MDPVRLAAALAHTERVWSIGLAKTGVYCTGGAAADDSATTEPSAITSLRASGSGR
jgi:hypothetical protein